MEEIIKEVLDDCNGPGWETSDAVMAKLCAGKLHDAGYRLDPYPNGKSKGELIARIEELEDMLNSARNFLHCVGISTDPAIISAINKFLDKTITVKP